MTGPRRLALLLACLLPPAAFAAPLTLEAALATADAPHPDLLLASAGRDAALAEQRLAEARNDWLVTLEAGARRVQRSQGPAGLTDDHNLRLNARRTLHDFGRESAGNAAARLETEAREADLLDARSRRRLEIMARYFDVLLADLQFVADNEYQAVAFVAFDQARDRAALGMVSPVDLAELEARLQERRLARNDSLKRQRISRAALAAAMNRPDVLAGELVEPVLPGNDRRPPPAEALAARLDGTPRLLAANSQVEAARQRIELLRAETAPALDLELEAGRHTRETGGRDDARAGLVLSWPLYQGGRNDARLAREQARFHALQANRDRLRLELGQTLLELALDIDHLRRVGRETARKHEAWRDLVLEKARGEYELEMRTNLGGSMAATMEARVRQRRVEYQLALALARLEALLGVPLANLPPGEETP